MKKLLRALIRPKVFIPLVLAVALIVALLSFADLKKVAAIMAGFRRIDLLYYLLLMIGYEVVRGVQWRYTMVALGVQAPPRTEIFAYVLSEVTKVLPIGNYFQNYVLQQSKGVDFGLTSAATTLVVLEEVAVSLVGVVALGLGAWTTWLRLVIIIGLAVFALGVWIFSRLYHGKGRPDWITRRRGFNNVADELDHFREGAADLMNPRSVAITLALSAVYQVLAGLALYVVVQAIGEQSVSFTQALSVYLFSLAFSLIFPLPIDFGVLEVSGVGAFLAVGVARNTALSAVFVNRILSILSSIIIAAVVVVFLRGEIRPLFTHMSKGGADEQRQTAGDAPASEAGE
jgi:uncharacterized protein (TIRG00374 family)